MSSTPFFVPENDQQLDALIASMNAANGKYFDTAVSTKRSEKLRDCICEGLGFTNGGYQELKAYWAAQKDFSFSDPQSVVGLTSKLHNGQVIAILAASFLKGNFDRILAEHFPQNEQKFLSADESFESTDPNKGWGLSIFDSDNDIRFVRRHSDAGELYPLYCRKVIIGYAFTIEEAKLINGMVIGSMPVGLKLHCDNPTDAWLAYLAVNTPATDYGKFIVLYQESVHTGIYLEFDKVEILNGKLVATKAGQVDTIFYDPAVKALVWQGMCFYMLTISTFGLKKDLTVTIVKGDQNRTLQNVEMIEWVGGKSFKCLEDDHDFDEVTELSLNQNIFDIR